LESVWHGAGRVEVDVDVGEVGEDESERRGLCSDYESICKIQMSGTRSSVPGVCFAEVAGFWCVWKRAANELICISSLPLFTEDLQKSNCRPGLV
jgi:hypothetical protein